VEQLLLFHRWGSSIRVLICFLNSMLRKATAGTALIILFSVGGIISAFANPPLLDGSYFGYEEGVTVRNGRLASCNYPGPNYGSCKGFSAIQLTENTIKINLSGVPGYLNGSRVLCKVGATGSNDQSKQCTSTGWR